MRSFTLALIFLFIAPQAFCKTVIVSDVDDTIRSFHSGAGYLEMYNNATDPNRAFRGMSEIFNYLSNSGAEINYVTAAIEPFIGYSIEFLTVNQFPQDYNYSYKGWLEDTFDFKTRQILEILSDVQETDTIVLLGDNGDRDVEVYSFISLQYPQSVVFIHKLFSTPIAPGQIPYLTGADLSMTLAAHGFLTTVQRDDVLQKIIADIKSGDEFVLDMIWPHWGETTQTEVDSVFSDVSPASELIKKAIFP